MSYKKQDKGLRKNSGEIFFDAIGCSWNCSGNRGLLSQLILNNGSNSTINNKIGSHKLTSNSFMTFMINNLENSHSSNKLEFMRDNIGWLKVIERRSTK